MNKCFLFTRHPPPHHVLLFFPCGVIHVSAFSRADAGVQTYASVWGASGAWGLMWRSVGESKDGVADNGVLFVFCHMSSPLSCRPDTCGSRTGNQVTPSTICPFLTLKQYPNVPLSGALAQFGDNCSYEDILGTPTKHDSNLFHH